MPSLPSGLIATKSYSIRFLVRELYMYASRVLKMIFTTRANSYIGTTIVVPDVDVAKGAVNRSTPYYVTITYASFMLYSYI